MEIGEFLLARIAEDEAAARSAIEPAQMHPWGDTRLPKGKPEDVPAWVYGYLGGTWGLHFARWDPARVLAECEAKRQQIATLADDWWSGGDGGMLRDRLLGMMSAPYADHPNCDEAWRP